MPRRGTGRAAFFLVASGALLLALALRAYQLQHAREVRAVALGTVVQTDVRPSGLIIVPHQRSNRDLTRSPMATTSVETLRQSAWQAQAQTSPVAVPPPSARNARPEPFSKVSPGAQRDAASPLPSSAHPELPAGVPYASKSDPVRIQSIELSSKAVRAGDVASARVITTSNAAALTARIGSYQVTVPRVAPGTFALTITVPRLPLPNRTVDIIVTAIRSDGATAQRTISIHVYL